MDTIDIPVEYLHTESYEEAIMILKRLTGGDIDEYIT